MPSLKDKTVLIIGRGSGIARAIAMAVSEDGGRAIVAGRHPDDLAAAYHGLDMGVEQVDVTDESSIATLAGRIAAVDHVVCTASARARGAYRDLTASTVNASFGTKVTGPGMVAVAAVDAVTVGLAVELAPVRVNAIAPGTIDTGAYDALGDERKAALFKSRSETAPARRIGTADDIAAVALAVLANGYLTGASIPVDGGEHLV
jgi:NAD(P)-dependent dehydrogenase (short-subunit alcohol dehydrogenase family)